MANARKIDFDLSDAEKTLEEARKKARKLQKIKERRSLAGRSNSSINGRSENLEDE
jgi:hypothetical protein